MFSETAHEAGSVSRPAEFRRHVLAATIAATLLATVSPRAHAADEAEIPAEDGNKLEEIVVTAQRRAENQQRVPISISMIRGDDLAANGVRNINALSAQVPNMQTTTPYGDAVPIFSLRGVSAVDFSQNQSSPVALYVDEVYKGLPVLTSLQIFDVERVEVLRGPQGTLYGKNTTGGAVNIYTKGASLEDGLSGYVDLGYGSLNRREASAAINVPMGDSMATRFAGQVTKADGMVENLYPGRPDQSDIDDWAVRLSSLWAPNDDLKFSLRLAASESSPLGYGVIADNIGRAGPGGAGFGTGYTREGLSFLENEADTTGSIRIRNKSASLNVQWNLTDDMTLSSVTSYDDGNWHTDEDADGTPYNLGFSTYISEARALSQEFRLGSAGDGPLNWQVGLYGYKDTVSTDTTLRLYYAFSGFDADGVPFCFIDFVTGCRLHNRMRQDRESFAVYGQATYDLTERLSLTAGLRYTDDNNELEYYRAAIGYYDPTTDSEVIDAVPTIDEAPVDQLTTTNWSARLSAQFQLTDATMLYAAWSRGYRGGAFNGQAFYAPEEVTTADPEEVTSVEIGAKSQLADDRLRLNGSIFHYDYKNQQFINVTPELLQVLYNVPKSRLYGGEIEATATFTPALDARLAVSYLDAEFREATLFGTDISGNRMLLAPEWTVLAGIDWRMLTTAWGTLALHTDSRYTSKSYFDPFNTEAVAQEGYVIHDARLSLEVAQSPVTVTAWVRNLTDEEYRVYRLDLAAIYNLDYGQRGRPREYGLSVRYDF